MLRRSDITIIGKGGHPFRDSRDAARLSHAELNKDLSESLARLKTSYLDVFLLHRDDEQRYADVGPVVDAVAALVASGKCRAWGTSNWTLSRLRAACEYADSHGLPPPTVVSDQLSLATPDRPVWPGCGHLTRVAASYCASREIVVLAWAPLAEGFLCGGGGRSASNAQCWSTPVNCQRRARLSSLVCNCVLYLQ